MGIARQSWPERRLELEKEKKEKRVRRKKVKCQSFGIRELFLMLGLGTVCEDLSKTVTKTKTSFRFTIARRAPRDGKSEGLCPDSVQRRGRLDRW